MRGLAIFKNYFVVLMATMAVCSWKVQAQTTPNILMKEVEVKFYANNIGRVTSNPPGIDCLGEHCSAQFAANSTLTLTATPLPLTGNHFVGWKGACTGTSSTCTLKLDKNVNTEAVFKIERCFGAVGSGCRGLIPGNDTSYPAIGETERDVSVGSILHDLCCFNNPGGHFCGFDDSDTSLCRDIWDNKAVPNSINGRTWKYTFGHYELNQGDSFDLPNSLKAPDGTRLDTEDEEYCKCGEFCETDEDVRGQDYGTCGPKIYASFTANPTSGEASLTVNLKAEVSTKDTESPQYSYSWFDSGNKLLTTGQTSSVTFDKPGQYTIFLTVKKENSECKNVETISQKVTVKEKKPPNKTNSWGDTHLCTFDNLAYDFQAVGEFVFVKSTLPNDSFEVQVRQLPWGTRTDVSVNKAVAMNVSGDKVGFYSGKTPICYVNGSPQELTEGDDFALPKGGTVNKNGQTYTVRWQDESAVAEIKEFSYGFLINVYVADSYKNQVIGLMGNLDGNSKNDIATRSGVSLGTDLKFDVLYPGYADNWRISQNESLFCYAAGETTATFTDLNFPRKPAKVSNLSAEDRAKAEQICHEAGITNQILLENCILDVGLTGDKTFAQIPLDLADPQTAVTVTDTSTDSNSDGEGVDTTQCFISTVAGGN